MTRLAEWQSAVRHGMQSEAARLVRATALDPAVPIDPRRELDAITRDLDAAGVPSHDADGDPMDPQARVLALLDRVTDLESEMAGLLEELVSRDNLIADLQRDLRELRYREAA